MLCLSRTKFAKISEKRISNTCKLKHARPQVQLLFADADNGWPDSALRYH